MITILAIAYGILLIASIGMMYLHFQHDEKIEQMEKTIKYLLDENANLNSKQRINEQRFQKLNEPERIEIVHTYDDSKAPKFGGF